MTKKFLKINRKNFEKSIDIKVERVYTTYVGRKTTQIKGVIEMFKKITKEFLEENDINISEDFNNMELERLLKKEFEDEINNQIK